MAVIKKKWRGVKQGEIYPTTFEPGDECPDELEDAAAEAGALEGADGKATAKGKAS